MGGAKRNPGSETLRGEAPDGAQENNWMLTSLRQSSVWRKGGTATNFRFSNPF